MAEQLTGGGRGLNSGAGVVRGRGSESGGDPEHGKWLLGSSAESGAWRSSDSTAAQSTYAAEQGEGGGARVRGGAGGDGMQGGSRGATYRAAGNLGVRAQGNRREIPGELNAGGRCGRKGAELTRGPGASERGGNAVCGREASGRRQAAAGAVRSWAKPEAVGRARKGNRGTGLGPREECEGREVGRGKAGSG